ncbi:probable methyltransferase-like protein 25 isoform X2 [Macrobrachium rosenbergii]|uniref:probable methyltransferase-like protein 25 isoform X2 n=1 Tax=Macrobrachium rosenbergii TaxID=79674 RepID=UPI0034D58AFE
MASLEHINEVIKKVAKFLSPLLPLSSCHMVDYITADHWENLVPEQIREDLSNLPREQLQHIPSASLLNELGDEPVDSNWSLATSSLSSYLSAIRQHSLSSLGVLTPVDEILEIYGPQEVATLPMKGVMSKKKTHEVETMSRVISRLAKGCGVDWIVDLGSGKGYLSTSLALQYNLNVIAIDSSEENTSNAMVRKTKLQKFWKSLKKTEEDKLLGRPLKKGKHRRRKIKPAEASSNEAESRDCPSSQHNRDSSRHIAITAFVTENTNLLQVVKESIESEGDVSSGPLVEGSSSSITGNQSSSSGNECCDIVQNSDTRRLDDESAKYCIDRASVSERPQENGEETQTSQHCVVQDKGSPVTSQNKWSDVSKLGLVGLHTCGNLAPSSMKIFLSNPTLAFLCNVGCCYHLMEEEFSRNPFIDYGDDNQGKPKSQNTDQNHVPKHKPANPMHPSELPNLSLGFPLSTVLREERFSLGRNSRMLSCQPADRLNCTDMSSTMSLYWRSLLQVLLLHKVGNISDMAHVGRIAAKCQNFNEYARAAFAKLGIDVEIQEEELHEYDKKYGSHIRNLEMFFLFRASLAPIIEGLILLDRLAYLYEQCLNAVVVAGRITGNQTY